MTSTSSKCGRVASGFPQNLKRRSKSGLVFSQNRDFIFFFLISVSFLSILGKTMIFVRFQGLSVHLGKNGKRVGTFSIFLYIWLKSDPEPQRKTCKRVGTFCFFLYLAVASGFLQTLKRLSESDLDPFKVWQGCNWMSTELKKTKQKWPRPLQSVIGLHLDFHNP